MRRLIPQERVLRPVSYSLSLPHSAACRRGSGALPVFFLRVRASGEGGVLRSSLQRGFQACYPIDYLCDLDGRKLSYYKSVITTLSIEGSVNSCQYGSLRALAGRCREQLLITFLFRGILAIVLEPGLLRLLCTTRSLTWRVTARLR